MAEIVTFGNLRGRSAYEVALGEGFTGTPVEWLEALIGPVGPAPTVTASSTGLPEGATPTVTVTNPDEDVYHLAFALPKGDKGDPGSASLAIDDTVTTTGNSWSASKVSDELAQRLPLDGGPVTVNGEVTFEIAPTVPNSAFPITAISGLTGTLENKFDKSSFTRLPWVTPTNPGWEDFFAAESPLGAFAPLQFAREGDTVHARGSMKINGFVDVWANTLPIPEGYRPAQQLMAMAWNWSRAEVVPMSIRPVGWIETASAYSGLNYIFFNTSWLVR